MIIFTIINELMDKKMYSFVKIRNIKKTRMRLGFVNKSKKLIEIIFMSF